MRGTSLVVQWLILHASTAGGTGWIPGWGTKIPQATWRGQKKKKVTHERGIKFNKEETPKGTELIEKTKF